MTLLSEGVAMIVEAKGFRIDKVWTKDWEENNYTVSVPSSLPAKIRQYMELTPSVKGDKLILKRGGRIKRVVRLLGISLVEMPSAIFGSTAVVLTLNPQQKNLEYGSLVCLRSEAVDKINAYIKAVGLDQSIS